jgi:four helix bundle protein
MSLKNNINHFVDLIAWKKNHEAVLKIYKITKNFPKDELFGIVSQIRRAASSITANIAEGYGRFHTKDRIRFYYIARGSSTELQNHLILSHDLGYIDDKQFNELKMGIFEGYKIICGLIKSTELNFNK